MNIIPHLIFCTNYPVLLFHFCKVWQRSNWKGLLRLQPPHGGDPLGAGGGGGDGQGGQSGGEEKSFSWSGYWLWIVNNSIFLQDWHQLVQSIHGLQGCLHVEVSINLDQPFVNSNLFGFALLVKLKIIWLFSGTERSLSVSKEQEKLEQSRRWELFCCTTKSQEYGGKF